MIWSEMTGLHFVKWKFTRLVWDKSLSFTWTICFPSQAPGSSHDFPCHFLTTQVSNMDYTLIFNSAPRAPCWNSCAQLLNLAGQQTTGTPNYRSLSLFALKFLLQWLEVCCFTLQFIPSSQASWLTDSYWIIFSNSNSFWSLCTTTLSFSQLIKHSLQRNQRWLLMNKTRMHTYLICLHSVPFPQKNRLI